MLLPAAPGRASSAAQTKTRANPIFCRRLREFHLRRAGGAGRRSPKQMSIASD